MWSIEKFELRRDINKMEAHGEARNGESIGCVGNGFTDF